MRIIAGKLKGHNLHLPENKITRPLKDRVRESVFNLLTHSNIMSFQFEKSYVLDLYAGSGSFGLECLSRGAKYVYFVENEKSIIKILEKNIEKLKVKKRTKIFDNDVFNQVQKQSISSAKFDLIFCDPPFDYTDAKNLIENIYNKNLLKKNGIIILHRNAATKEKFQNYLGILDERIYGISKIIFGKFIS